MASCKRKWLTLREKIEILDFCMEHPKVGVRSVAIKFNVGRTQISNIVKEEEVLRDAWVSNKNEE